MWLFLNILELGQLGSIWCRLNVAGVAVATGCCWQMHDVVIVRKNAIARQQQCFNRSIVRVATR